MTFYNRSNSILIDEQLKDLNGLFLKDYQSTNHLIKYFSHSGFKLLKGNIKNYVKDFKIPQMATGLFESDKYFLLIKENISSKQNLLFEKKH